MSKKSPDLVIVAGDGNTPEIRDSVARHVLWAFGDHNGQEPGHFTKALLDAFAHADLSNFAKLQVAFPDYAFAWHAVGRTSWGLDWLRTKVMDAAVSA